MNVERDRFVHCPLCETRTFVRHLVSHMRSRCLGRPSPDECIRWVRQPDVQAMGIPSQTLSRLVQKGLVRRRGTRLDYVYMLVDVVKQISRRRLAS